MMNYLMRTSVLFTFCVLLFSCASSDEDAYISLKRKPFDKIITYEQSLGSVQLDGVFHGKAPSNFFPGRDSFDLDRSLMFLRQGDEVPLKTVYYFTPDSTIELILYEWNVVQPGMSLAQADSATRGLDKEWNRYEALFYSIAEEVGKQYGAVTLGDGKTVKEDSKLWDLWKKEVSWELQDKTIELKLVWMPKIGFRHHKILLKVYGFK